MIGVDKNLTNWQWISVWLEVHWHECARHWSRTGQKQWSSLFDVARKLVAHLILTHIWTEISNAYRNSGRLTATARSAKVNAHQLHQHRLEQIHVEPWRWFRFRHRTCGWIIESACTCTRGKKQAIIYFLIDSVKKHHNKKTALSTVWKANEKERKGKKRIDATGGRRLSSPNDHK